MRIRISFFDQSRFHSRDREAPIFMCSMTRRRERREVGVTELDDRRRGCRWEIERPRVFSVLAKVLVFVFDFKGK